jgi:hypothetical protein
MAKILSPIGVLTGQFVKAGHISQSIDAFTGTEAYDITLSGSFTLVNGTQGVNKVAISDANGKIDFVDASTLFTGSVSPSGSNAFPYTGSALITGSLGITGSLSHGNGNLISGSYSHAEGKTTIVSGSFAHAEGNQTNAIGDGSHAEGLLSISIGEQSHAEGESTQAYGDLSHAEGYLTISSGSYSHAEGESTTAYGDSSHAEGRNTTSSGLYSHAEGRNTISSGSDSHAEGRNTIAYGPYSHAEGYYTLASGDGAHAEGFATTASGVASHAEGQQTLASGQSSHAEGISTVASGLGQHVQGQWNISSSAVSAFILGNGNSASTRSNLIFASGSQVEITGSLIVSSSLTTQGSHIRKYRTVTLTDADFSANPPQNIQANDDIILFIDNTTVIRAFGEASFDITNFLNSSAGRCVELVKVKDGTGDGIVIASVSMAGVTTHINNTSYSSGKEICTIIGNSITLMSMGLANTGSAWGNGF